MSFIHLKKEVLLGFLSLDFFQNHEFIFDFVKGFSSCIHEIDLFFYILLVFCIILIDHGAAVGPEKP